MTIPPTVETHPKLHLWCIAEGMNDTAAAEHFGVSRQIVRLWRMPFDDPRRVRPRDDDLIERVMVRTKSGRLGAVCAADWFPPHLRGEPADPRGCDPEFLRLARSH
jgi:hypothetical protein